MTIFNATVQQYFESLVMKHGLRCISSTSEVVRFGNEKVFLQVMYESKRSFELRVEIGKSTHCIDKLERSFDLSEILKLHVAPESTYVDRLQVAKVDELVSSIEKLSVLTDKYASTLLDGSVVDFEMLNKFRDNECAEYAMLRNLRYARADAEHAWANQNYHAVVKAYQPYETELTESERKRLVFAKQK